MVDKQLCAWYEVFDLTWNFVMNKSNNPTTSEDLNESFLKKIKCSAVQSCMVGRTAVVLCNHYYWKL